MRSKVAILLLVAALFVVAVPFRVSQAQTACADETFLKKVGEDFTTISTILSAVNSEDPAQLGQTLLVISGLRQNYEDMGDVPAECLGTQLIVISFIANVGDTVSIKLTALADPTNAETYTKFAEAQGERITKYLALLNESLGITPTPSS